MQKKFITKSDQETIALGFKLGSELCGGEFIALTGDLGGGKTQFTKGIAKALGITETVVSPTFTIERIYQGTISNQPSFAKGYGTGKQSTKSTSLRLCPSRIRTGQEGATCPSVARERRRKKSLADANYSIQLHHFDLYRTQNDQEIRESILALQNESDTIVVVEWPENIEGVLPASYMAANFTYIDENTREITFSVGKGPTLNSPDQREGGSDPLHLLGDLA
jgi:tRNA A37 threonylcarbamoyladenosine biosynthesis protein TsaE